ncbi:SMH class II histocompatibility antigen, beta-1 chain-like [Eublepharis macularius]|uniref:SMH class II histocompatibility antigen, beta-1 chain-like n=1 Tax=Eublepharis macularius TaxID=481883 RepID=A0AA97J805_EUBMA|nr:SMH class II histocompatibility antigen, beta-1 chain-like [Eublepharis macularius]
MLSFLPGFQCTATRAQNCATRQPSGSPWVSGGGGVHAGLQQNGGGEERQPGAPWTALLPAASRGANGLGTPPPSAPEAASPSRPPLLSAAAHFLAQAKCECRFAHGAAGELRYLERHIYDRQEFVRFDSRRGRYEAVAELGEDWAAYWNSQPEILQNTRGAAQRFCRHNHEAWALLIAMQGSFFGGGPSPAKYLAS